MAKHSSKLIFIFSLFIFLIVLWDHPFFKYIKNLFVLLHEINHAIATILSGGKVLDISIHANENGFTYATSGFHKWTFLFIVSSGYIGSSMVGGLLLNRGFSEKYEKLTLLLFGLILFHFSYYFSSSTNIAYRIGIFSGAFFVFIGLFSKFFSSIALIILGISLSLYSVYDLLDLIYNIHQTDAGLLAEWWMEVFGNYSNQYYSKLAYSFAIIWSFVSIFILSFILLKTFYKKETIAKKVASDFAKHIYNGNITLEDAERLFYSKGIDLNGKPLPKELKKEKN